MSTFWQFVLLGFGLCPAYVLAAQGTVLVYRGSGVVNFAQGAFGMIGAYASLELQNAGFAPVPALVGGVLAGALAGAVTDLVVMRRLVHASQVVRIVATLGLSVFVTQALALHFANNSSYPNPIISKTTVYVFGAHISRYELGLLAITVGLTAALWAAYRYTTFGLRTSAVSENARAAAALGHSPELIGLINWTLGGALGGLAGILISADLGLTLTTTGYLLVPALAAALLGRFTSFWLTLLGGLIVAVGSSLLTYYNPGTGWSDAFPFLMVIAILLFRSNALPARGEFAQRLPTIGTGRIRWPIVIPGLVVTIVVIAMLSANGQNAVTASLLVGIILLSLTVVTGYAGQISLAQLGLAGMGGFFAARFSASSGLTFWEALIVGVVVAVASGVIVGLPALRTRGVSLAIVTLGLGLTIEDVVLNNSNLAGSGGELQTHQPTLLGYALDNTDHPGRYAVFCLILFALCAIIVANLRRGRVGRQLIALRANERAAVVLGINTTIAKLYAFVLAAGIAGLAGVLIAFQPTVIVFVPNSGGPLFDPVTSITLFSLLVVGGIGYIGGSIIAAQIATIGTGAGVGGWVLQLIFHSATANNWLPVLGGAASVATVMFYPDGIAAKNAHDFARLLGLRPFRFLDRPERRVTPAAPLASIVGAAGAAGDAVLEIKDLGVRFGGVVALAGVSLEVRSGEIVGLIGPNGAGKTALVDAVSGLNRSYTGSILLNGEAIDRYTPTRRARVGIGRSFQQPELSDDLVVEDNLRVACEPPRPHDYLIDLLAPRQQQLPRAAAIAVSEFELGEDLARKPGELPFGKRRLVGIARAVAATPKILLLDEPAAGLDDHEADELASLITRLARERGYGILLIEHNVNLVMGISDHVTALDFGKVIAAGTPEEVRHNPALISAYLGDTFPADQPIPAAQA